jgi:hypothetical protein
MPVGLVRHGKSRELLLGDESKINYEYGELADICDGPEPAVYCQRDSVTHKSIGVNYDNFTEFGNDYIRQEKSNLSSITRVDVM